MDAGHNFTTKKSAPSVQAATDKCQALEELATRQVKRVNAAHQAMAQETKRLDDLQQRFSEVREWVLVVELIVEVVWFVRIERRINSILLVLFLLLR